MRKILLIVTLLAAVSFTAGAQRWSVGTNVFDLGCIGTLNIEAGAAMSQHFSFQMGAKYNPWTFKKDTPDQFEDRKRTFYAGVRYWPWYIYSGFWASANFQYQEYNHGGFINETSEEGDAIGGCLSVGYTRMLHKNLNLEFGAGVWAGQTKYRLYSCPLCGEVLDDGSKFFFLPNEIRVGLVYIF